MTTTELRNTLLQEGWVEGYSDIHSMDTPDFPYNWMVHKMIRREGYCAAVAEVYTYPNMEIMVELLDYNAGQGQALTHDVYNEGEEVEALAHATRFITERTVAA